MNSNKTQFPKLKTKSLLLISIFTIITLLITRTKSQKDQSSINQSSKTHHNLKIENKDDLKKFVEILLGEEMHKDYSQLSRSEQMFFDIFIKRMVNSYNYTDFSSENIKKHMTPENIEVQKELAFEDFSYDYHIIEEELDQQIKDNNPPASDFYDDDLGKDDEGDDEGKVKVKASDNNEGKNEL